MGNSVRGSLLVVLVAGMAGAQSMLEHAAVTGPAATGASAGAMIGSRLGQIMGSVQTTAAAAGKTGEPAAKKSAVKNAPATAPAVASIPLGSTSTRQRQATAPAARKPVSELATIFDPPAAATLAPLPPPTPAVTKEHMLAELQGIEPGFTRDQVIAKLGAPATRISYSDGAAFVERVRFRAAGEDVVVVEFKNGVVDTAKQVVR